MLLLRFSKEGSNLWLRQCSRRGKCSCSNDQGALFNCIDRDIISGRWALLAGGVPVVELCELLGRSSLAVHDGVGRAP